MVFVDFAYREVDALGRIVLPAAWRREMSRRLILFKLEDEIIIKEKRPGAFRKLRGTLKPVGSAKKMGELKAAGAMDWKRE